MNDDNDDYLNKINEITVVITRENAIVSTKNYAEHGRSNYKVIQPGLLYGARIAFAVWKAKGKIKAKIT